jgi:hypothetical protein
VTEAIVRALAEGLLARDVSVRVETGRPSGVQEGWRALVFIDASRYDTAWLQAWLGLGRTALVEVRDPALWCAAVGRLPRGFCGGRPRAQRRAGGHRGRRHPRASSATPSPRP